MEQTSNSSMSAVSRRRKSLKNDRKGRPWSSLIPDLLISIIIRLGVIDFHACAGVCKYWREVAAGYRSTYLQNQQPLTVVKSVYAKKSFYLYNVFDGTSYKTKLPDVTFTHFVGLSCGYLIMLSAHKTFWLMNLITRHQIHFPMTPGGFLLNPSESHAIVFYWEDISDYLVLVIHRKLSRALLSRSSGADWREVYGGRLACYVDIAYFKRNVYVLTKDALLGKLRLDRQFFECIDVKLNIPKSTVFPIHLVSSKDQLFMVSYVKHKTFGVVIMVHQLDERRMEWKQVNGLGEEALFLSNHSCALINPTKWGGCGNCIYLLSTVHNKWSAYYLNASMSFWSNHIVLEKEAFMRPHFWYFPHQIYEKNGINCDAKLLNF